MFFLPFVQRQTISLRERQETPVTMRKQQTRYHDVNLYEPVENCKGVNIALRSMYSSPLDRIVSADPNEYTLETEDDNHNESNTIDNSCIEHAERQKNNTTMQPMFSSPLDRAVSVGSNEYTLATEDNRTESSTPFEDSCNYFILEARENSNDNANTGDSTADRDGVSDEYASVVKNKASCENQAVNETPVEVQNPMFQLSHPQEEITGCASWRESDFDTQGVINVIQIEGVTSIGFPESQPDEETHF